MIKYLKKNPIYCAWMLIIIIIGITDLILTCFTTKINDFVFGDISFENLMNVDLFWCGIMLGPMAIISLIFLPFIEYESRK